MWLHFHFRIGNWHIIKYWSWYPRPRHAIKMLINKEYRDRYNDEIPF